MATLHGDMSVQTGGGTDAPAAIHPGSPVRFVANYDGYLAKFSSDYCRSPSV